MGEQHHFILNQVSPGVKLVDLHVGQRTRLLPGLNAVGLKSRARGGGRQLVPGPRSAHGEPRVTRQGRWVLSTSGAGAGEGEEDPGSNWRGTP